MHAWAFANEDNCGNTASKIGLSRTFRRMLGEKQLWLASIPEQTGANLINFFGEE